ncbi:MAG: hypothetical protein U5K79_03890 [Cyclobacteriaceae bacterium]|nr:hypothetical protein [Cyclobacteriaceae bacterium]
MNEKRTSQISLGLFLPTLSEDKYSLTMMGLMSNYYRISQVSPAYTIYGNYSFKADEEKKYILGGEIGPEVLIPKTEGETELLFHMSLVAGWKFDNLSLWAEFNNILIASEPEFGFQ